jgi:NTP pyrophosphatase (non-canonical NTP hydrolase)
VSSLGYVILPKPNGLSEAIRYDVFVAGLFKFFPEQSMMMLHACMGIAGEAGELTDAVKKHIFYEKPLDRENVIEELGDLRFYIQAMQNLLNVNEQEILQYNADKLAKRYVGLRYSNEAAISRADKNVEDKKEE